MVRTEIVTVHDALRAGLPTVLLIIGTEPMEPLLAFFREKSVSLSAERGYAQAVGRFVEWLSVRAPEFHEQSQRSLLYAAFVYDLRFGSYQDGIDQYGLNWLPISDGNLRRLNRCLIEFSDWLVKRYGTSALNPIHHQASYGEQMAFWRQWNARKAKSMLAHIKSRRGAVLDATVGRRHALPRQKSAVLIEVKAFPVENIDALLWKGFALPGSETESRPWLKYDLRDILITLLCLYGGCRESEPMHLWVDDVFTDPADPEVALVLIHEPDLGAVFYTDPLTRTKRKTTRADFLQRYCNGRKPLTQETGRRHSGWKGALLTHPDRKAFQVIWIDRNAGRLFLELWLMYMKHVRPVVLQMPWAFLTKDNQPLGAEGYTDAFNAAMRKIRVAPIKSAGTSTHGLRHRYGQWLNELGIGDKEGQIAMHHLNAKSQEIYRQIGLAKVVESVRGKQVLSLPSFIADEGLL